MGRKINHIDLSHISMVLKFYEAIGFERLPIKIPDTICDNIQCIIKEQALKNLRDEIGDCKMCRLSQKRAKLVFGAGNPDAKLMFIGEAPGEEEDRQGLPFVGRAGTLLTRLIEKMKLTRDEVYIANTVKCRPPGNRNPFEDEVETCMPFLAKQIEVINPLVIITLGNVATKALLNDIGTITKVRGKVFRHREIPVVPTFHPSYLLKNPRDKWLTWSDAQTALRLLAERSK